MRITGIVICIAIIVLAIFFVVTGHSEALLGSGKSARNPPLILVVILAIIGLWANLKKQY
jgi:hypothetical protein